MPFLFLIVAKGLDVLFKNAVLMGLYEGYKVGGLALSHLQFADDTLIFGRKCLQNLWTIKAVLQLFELVSRLKVNFHKSQLLGLNVDGVWLQEAASFLNCKIGTFPFVYLGLPIGADGRRMTTWKPVLEKIKFRLASWDSKHLSLGGKVVLLKSVLTALLIYFFSFFKAPEGVIRSIETMFKRFLWGGSEEKRSIHWVAWAKICRDKVEGGLGLKI